MQITYAIYVNVTFCHIFCKQRAVIIMILPCSLILSDFIACDFFKVTFTALYVILRI